MHDHSLDKQAGGLAALGGAGHTFFEQRQRMLQVRWVLAVNPNNNKNNAIFIQHPNQ